MADSNIYQNVANVLANTDQSIQSTFDYLKEFLQDFNIWFLTTMVIISVLLYVSIITFAIRGGVFLYNKYKENFNMMIKLMFDINQTKSKK